MSDKEYMRWLKKIDAQKEKAIEDEAEPTRVLIAQMLVSILMYLENRNQVLNRETLQKAVDEIYVKENPTH
jgi:hypothetical protein